MKHFLRRATNEALPTLHNLWRRKVVKSAMCPSCNCAPKCVIHTRWQCHCLIVIWEDNEIIMKLLRRNGSSFAGLLEMVFSLNLDIDIDLLAMIFWLIWNKRNLDNHGDSSVELHQIRSKARALIQDFIST